MFAVVRINGRRSLENVCICAAVREGDRIKFSLKIKCTHAAFHTDSSVTSVFKSKDAKGSAASYGKRKLESFTHPLFSSTIF